MQPLNLLVQMMAMMAMMATMAATHHEQAVLHSTQRGGLQALGGPQAQAEWQTCAGEAGQGCRNVAMHQMGEGITP